jgi:hypothetical protein
MHPMHDHELPEPYRSWIDRARPLPENVRLLPRSIPFVHDLLFFILSVVMLIGIGVLFYLLFWEELVRGPWTPIVLVGGAFLLVALIPAFSFRRLRITMGADRDVKDGTLRQGILVGPEGVLVRIEPNDCYAIPLNRFVAAKIVERTPGEKPGRPKFVVDTQDGPVEVLAVRLLDTPKTLNRCVAKLRPSPAMPPPADVVDDGAEPPPQGILGRLLSIWHGDSDPTRHWSTKADEPLPAFDPATGAFGGLRFGDPLVQAQFLGRPDRVEQTDVLTLHYTTRGFELSFEEGEFSLLVCAIGPQPDAPPKPGQGFSRPWIAGAMQLAPETTIAGVCQVFGQPDNNETHAEEKILEFVRGPSYMNFAFELSNGRLWSWSTGPDD